MRRGPSTIDIYRHHMHSATRGTRAPWARPGMWEELLQSVDVRKECADESVRSGVLSTVALSSVHDNWTWSTLTAAHDERRRRRSWLASRMATTQGGDTGEMRSLRTIAQSVRLQCAPLLKSPLSESVHSRQCSPPQAAQGSRGGAQVRRQI